MPHDTNTVSLSVGRVVSFQFTDKNVTTGACVSIVKFAPDVCTAAAVATSLTASRNTRSAKASDKVGRLLKSSMSPARTTYASEYDPSPWSTKLFDTFTPFTRQHAVQSGTKPTSRHAAVSVTFSTPPGTNAPTVGDNVTEVMAGTSRTNTVSDCGENVGCAHADVVFRV